MVELSSERIEKILHEETAKKEDLDTILRSIYTRYMCLYEKYFENIDALNEEKIAELKKYHEETKSLIKYYYMDIPQDICSGIKEFENEYNAKLLGPKWHEYLFDAYDDFRSKNDDEYNSEGYYKLEFSKQALETFYEAMDYVFREGFGTNSKVISDTVSGLVGMFFGKE